MFLPRQKGQTFLLPVDIRTKLPENPLRDLVDEVCELFFDSFGVAVVARGNDNVGSPAFPPQVLAKVLLFAYINGVFSSRQIKKKTIVDLEFMYLAENYVLEYRTVARFRVENMKLFEQIFLYFLTVLKQLKMLNQLAFYTDSMKVKANASNDQYLTKTELELYKELIEDAIRKHETIDAEEDRLYEKVEAGVEKKSVRKMKRKIKEIIETVKEGEAGMKKAAEKSDAVKEKLEKVEEKNLKGINMTDEDAVFMKTDKVITHSYSFERTVDSNQFIVAHEVLTTADDYGEGIKQLEQTKKNLGLESLHGTTHCADGGFATPDLLEYYEKNGIMGLVPQKKFRKGKHPLSNYKYDEKTDGFTAPDGTVYAKTKTETKNNRTKYFYEPDFWHEGLRKKIVVDDDFFLRERARKRLEQNRESYKKRASTIEPVHGDLKHNRKYRTVSLRKTEKIAVEMSILDTAHNMRRCCSMKTKREQPKPLECGRLVQSKIPASANATSHDFILAF